LTSLQQHPQSANLQQLQLLRATGQVDKMVDDSSMDGSAVSLQHHLEVPKICDLVSQWVNIVENANVLSSKVHIEQLITV